MGTVTARELTYDDIIGYIPCPVCETAVFAVRGDVAEMTQAQVVAAAKERLRSQCPDHQPVKVGEGGRLPLRYEA